MQLPLELVAHTARQLLAVGQLGHGRGLCISQLKGVAKQKWLATKNGVTRTLSVWGQGEHKANTDRRTWTDSRNPAEQTERVKGRSILSSDKLCVGVANMQKIYAAKVAL